MSLFNSLKSNLYSLTPKGKKKAEDIVGRTPEGLILCHLEDHGESSPSEIAEETHLDSGLVKQKLKKLRHLHYVASKEEIGFN